MFSGIGFGGERIGLAALKFPKIASLCLLAMMVLVGATLPRVSFDDDIHRVFLSNSPLSQAQIAYEADQSPPLSTIIIHATSPTAFTAADMSSLRDLSLDLEFLDGVTAVASPFILRGAPDADAPSGRPVFGSDITEDYPDTLARFDALDTGLPTFLNASRMAMLLTVSVDTDQTAVADAVADITREVSQSLPMGVSATLTGEDAISAEIVSGLKDDLISLNIWGALMIALAALVFLRDLRMVLLAVVPATAGAAGVLALSVWLGYPITVISNVIPILLLVLGVADGVHLAGHVKAGGSVRGAVQDVGPACALTALTTALAFASITLTGNVQLFEFAVLGAAGTLLSFVIVIVGFALMGRIMALSDRPVPRFSASAAQRLAIVGTARPRTTAVVCLLLLAVSAVGFSQTKAWFPLYQNLPGSSATLATNDAIADNFGGVFQMIVEADGEWTQFTHLAQQLETTNGRGTVLSDLNVARWLGHPDTAPTDTERGTLPQSLASQLRTGDDTWRIFVSVPEPMRSPDALAKFDAVYDVAIANGADRVLGLPTVMRQEAVTLIKQLATGLVAATIGATLLVALAFRSLRLVPILIVPNVLPLMLTGASLHLWAQGELSPTAVLALTLAFGVAIDDTVHFLNRFSAARTNGRTVQDAIAAATRSAGQVMVLTTLLLTVGLCITLFSGFTPVRMFGGMMIVTLWAALLIDLVLLPALFTWKGSRHDVA